MTLIFETFNLFVTELLQCKLKQSCQKVIGIKIHFLLATATYYNIILLYSPTGGSGSED